MQADTPFFVASVDKLYTAAVILKLVERGRLGLDEPIPSYLPQTLIGRLHRLHAALEEAGIEGPYVLAGHSLGGSLSRVYAEMYPEEVAGMALLDSAHPDMLDRFPAEVAEQ